MGLLRMVSRLGNSGRLPSRGSLLGLRIRVILNSVACLREKARTSFSERSISMPTQEIRSSSRTAAPTLPIT